MKLEQISKLNSATTRVSMEHLGLEHLYEYDTDLIK